MASSITIPRDFKPSATAIIEGKLKRQPELKALRTGTFCEGIVMVKEAGYRVRCHGAVAEDMAICKGGTPLLVKGRLSTHAWKTEDRKQHEQVVIVAESVKSLIPIRVEDMA